MKSRLKPFSKRYRARGMTLIEVLAGVALLGSLLVGVVLARGRYIRQWTTAQHRLEAVQAADALLNQWWASEDSVPRSGMGSCGERRSLRWQTRLIESEEGEDLKVQ